jgi:HlyD family secretion protein
MVDVPRTGYARKKRIRQILFTALVLVALAVATWGLSRLEPAPPSVERSSVFIGKVDRGPLVVEVRGPGTLVPPPESIRWVAASTEGRVEKIPVLPGTSVREDTVLVILDNPELEREVQDSKLQLQKEEAELQNLRVDLQRQALDQEASAAGIRATFLQQRLQANLNESLAKQGLISNLDLQLSQLSAEESEKRYQLEQKRLQMNSEATEAQLQAKEASVAQIRGMYQLRRRQLDMLQVRAGIRGVLQETPIEVGQRVSIGGILGKVAVPGKLQAELKIPETQTKDLVVGLPAKIDTRNGIIPGEVVRVDPAAKQGTVTVDVALKGALPPGARPDLNVDGTIQIDRLDNVLKMSRPAFGQADSTIGIFRLVRGGNDAVRVRVHLGRTSVTTVQVIEGLNEGDEVILSDTSAYDEFDRIRLD